MNVTSGNVAKNWSNYKESWNDYKIAKGLREKDLKNYVATLRGIIGKDCYNLSKRLPLEDENKKFKAFLIV